MIKYRKTKIAAKLKKARKGTKAKIAKVQEKPKIKETTIPAMTHKLKKNTEKLKSQ